MSNQLALATATFTLTRQLNRVVGVDVAGAVATSFRPDGADGALPAVGVNVYLWQTNPNGELGNTDLPTRNVTRAIVNKPQAIVDLVYLLTFYGAELKLEPQRIQASVLRYLHAEPCLTKQMIRDAMMAALAADANHFLKGSNLADQQTTIRLTPYKISLEDLSKIWSVFFQTHYVLTSTFCARYVALDGEDAGQNSLPVRERRVFALPRSDMFLASISPDRVPFAPNADIKLVGNGLVGPNKSYLIDGVPGALQPGSTAELAIVRLPAGLRAGLRQVRVLDQSPLGANHFGTESNAAPFSLLPAVQNIVYVPDPGPRRDHTVTATVTPPLVVGLDQRVELLLNRTPPPAAGVPAAYALTARPRTAEADPLVFAARDVATGTYIYRLRIDGVDSEMTIDLADPDPLNQPYDGPTVVVPP